MGTTAQQRPTTGVRTAILASADPSFRQRLRAALTELRWQVREAGGGAETLAFLETAPAETVVLDSWLPDLDIREFVSEFANLHPGVDLVMADASTPPLSVARSPRRNEILHALRRAQATDGPAWDTAPDLEGGGLGMQIPEAPIISLRRTPKSTAPSAASARLPELVGSDPAILEVGRRVRLVAPRSTSVLIEGPTGSGKEVVARAIHRLSRRASRKFVALNCAAIPEALLEAELFGHTRGAFTGAVQGRAGRIEAADGGTLFLDEIGEMPLILQAKLLRFLETGELQRVGDNDPVRVDVRILAATHRPLARLAAGGEFRTDLYYRLAVFLIRTPGLAGRSSDIHALIEHFLRELGRESPMKGITPEAVARLRAHPWPGNVRELSHVLERAWILAEDRPAIGIEEIEFDEPG